MASASGTSSSTDGGSSFSVSGAISSACSRASASGTGSDVSIRNLGSSSLVCSFDMTPSLRRLCMGRHRRSEVIHGVAAGARDIRLTPIGAGRWARMLRFRIKHALSRQLWVIPVIGIVAGAGLSVVTVAIDCHLASLVPQDLVGSPSDASTILTTIATSVVTLTSIVLTITLVAIQLAMGQFSPRIVRALLDDRGNQIAVALFGGTFTFAVFSLRAVGTGPGGDPTPGVTVLTAFVLVAASSAAL